MLSEWDADCFVKYWQESVYKKLPIQHLLEMLIDSSQLASKDVLND